MKLPPTLRVALARASLLLLAASLTVGFPFRSLPKRLIELPRLFLARRDARVDPSGFWFDPDYAAFLEAVRQSTPENATVALIAPTTIKLYVYEAAYWLVPRRIVGEREDRQAAFVAVYAKARATNAPSGAPIPGGVLVRR